MICCTTEYGIDWLDILSKASSIVIAAANLFLAYYVFVHNNEQSEKSRKKANNIDWLKALILNENLQRLYKFYDDLHITSKKLSQPRLTMPAKAAIILEIESQVEDFRQDFIELLLAINGNLYDNVLSIVDQLLEDLSISASDPGKNLNHQPLFKSEFTTKINSCKTDTIKVLFNYDGE